MEATEELPKKLNDEVVLFVRKRSDVNAARYTARLKQHVDLHRKRRRAANARHHVGHSKRSKSVVSKKKGEPVPGENTDNANADAAGREDDRTSRRGDHHKCVRSRSFSRTSSNAPSDKCCRRRRRRRRSRRRRRRRSCRRKRRRRRSRRRRRRSCKRRRRRSRRRRRRRRRC